MALPSFLQRGFASAPAPAAGKAQLKAPSWADIRSPYSSIARHSTIESIVWEKEEERRKCRKDSTFWTGAMLAAAVSAIHPVRARFSSSSLFFFFIYYRSINTGAKPSREAAAALDDTHWNWNWNKKQGKKEGGKNALYSIDIGPGRAGPWSYYYPIIFKNKLIFK